MRPDVCTCDPTPTLDAAAARAGAVARDLWVRVMALRAAGEQANTSTSITKETR